MPNYMTHSIINTSALGMMFAYEIGKGAPIEQVLPAIAGAAFATFVVNPDVDMPMTLAEEWGYWKRRPLVLLWRLLWLPYAWLIDHIPQHFGMKDGHRSPLSHFPIVGTIGRALYLAPFALLLSFFLPVLPSMTQVLFFLYGWGIADATHYAADSVFSGVHHGYASRHAAHIHDPRTAHYEIKKSPRAQR